jgi:O-antigen/teichoic acid export membrane protein
VRVLEHDYVARMPAPTDDPVAVSEVLDSAEAGGRFIRGSLARLTGYGVSILLSLVAAPLVIRHLGPTDYGYFAALGVREFASGRPDRIRLLRNLVGLRVTATAAAISLATAVAAVVGAPAVVVDGVMLGGVGLIVTIAGENYGIPLSADLRITAVSLLGLAQQVTITATYVILVIVGARVLPLVAATIASGAVLLGGTALLVRRHGSLIPAFDRRQWVELLRQTLPYAVATAVGIIYFREALILISVLTTERQTGYYAAAFRIVEVLTAVPWTLISAALPIFARAAHQDDDARLGYALQRLFEVSAIVGVWMAGSVLVGASFGIAVVGGSGYTPSVVVLQIQGLAVVTSFMVALFGSMLLSLRLFRPLVWSNAVAVLVATILSLALIPDHGARGAAIAPTAAEACLALAYAWSLRRARPELVVSLATVPRIALATAVSLALALALPIPSVVRLVVFGATYFAGLWALRAIPFEVVNAVLRRQPPSGL